MHLCVVPTFNIFPRCSIIFSCVLLLQIVLFSPPSYAATSALEFIGSHLPTKSIPGSSACHSRPNFNRENVKPPFLYNLSIEIGLYTLMISSTQILYCGIGWSRQRRWKSHSFPADGSRHIAKYLWQRQDTPAFKDHPATGWHQSPPISRDAWQEEHMGAGCSTDPTHAIMPFSLPKEPFPILHMCQNLVRPLWPGPDIHYSLLSASW